jgi:hypothetical protein
MNDHEYMLIASRMLDYLGDQRVYVSETYFDDDMWDVIVDGHFDVRGLIDVVIEATRTQGSQE